MAEIGKQYQVSNVVENAHISEHGQLQVGNHDHTHFHTHTAAASLLAALRTTDPRHDKERIEKAGGLLRDSYVWILNNEEYLQWSSRTHQEHLLWVRGDPGKGKTMLLCGIIDELSKTSSCIIGYFFCQATHKALSSATSVLRGLIYMLAVQEPSIRSQVETTYKDAAEEVFEDHNAWVALCQVMEEILADERGHNLVLVIDGLDECLDDRDALISFISLCTKKHGAKWIVSSRNWPEIEVGLEDSEDVSQLNLELNQEQVSEAVSLYISHRVQRLKAAKKYETSLAMEVQEYLQANSNGTFLWVALVCKELAAPRVTKRHTRQVLTGFPRGLPELYRRMMTEIQDSMDREMLVDILAIMSCVYRPVSVGELRHLCTPFAELGEDETEQVIQSCGSFLTVQKGMVCFVHQSAQDFLLNDCSALLSTTAPLQHERLFMASIKAVRKVLRPNIYRLNYFGTRAADIVRPSPDPLDTIEYSCIYLLRHFHDSVASSQQTDISPSELTGFFSNHLLTWLEALSILEKAPENCVLLRKLASTKLKSDDSRDILQDVSKYVTLFLPAIISAPLQIYSSGSLFCPTQSWVHEVFRNISAPEHGIRIRGKIESKWSQCIVAFEDSYSYHSKTISPDGTLCAAAHIDVVSIWETSTGGLLNKIFVGGSLANEDRPADDERRDGIGGMQLLGNARLCICSGAGMVSLWDIVSGKELRRTKISGCYTFLSASLTAKFIMMVDDHPENSENSDADGDDENSKHGPEDECGQYSEGEEDPEEQGIEPGFKSVSVWNGTSGSLVASISDTSLVAGVFSADETLFALAFRSKTICIYDTESGRCVKTLENHPAIYSVAFEATSRLVFNAQEPSFLTEFCQDKNGASLWSIPFPLDDVTTPYQFGWNQDCSRVFYSEGMWGSLSILDAKEHKEFKILNYKVNDGGKVAISADGNCLLSAKRRQNVSVWDISDPSDLTHALDTRGLQEFAFAPSGRFAATMDTSDFSPRGWDAPPNTVSEECVVVWSSEMGISLKIPAPPPSNGGFAHIDFARDDKLLVTKWDGESLQVWDAATSTCLATMKLDTPPMPIRFSPDSSHLAMTIHREVQIHDISALPSRKEPRMINPRERSHVGLSPDNSLLVTCSPTLTLWSVASGEALHDFGRKVYVPQFSSDGSQIIAAHASSHLLGVWDVASFKEIYRIGSAQHTRLNDVVDYSNSSLTLRTQRAHFKLKEVGCADAEALFNLGLNSDDVSSEKDGIKMLEAVLVGYAYGTDYHSLGWIMRGKERFLWLPPQYRPVDTAAYNSGLTIGLETGQILFLNFDENAGAAL